MTIFFPGSFNPFTKGHADILMRLLKLAEKVIVGIGINADKPSSSQQAMLNKAAIEEYIEVSGVTNRVKVVVYSGLTAEEALKQGATCMARGVRTTSDFEYENSLACANRAAFGIETIILPADPALSFVSSSIIRDLLSHGREDIADNFLP